jgi:TRAP-type C4-dicarboxylate transport system substrate-binding protein
MPSFALAQGLQQYAPFVSPIIAVTRNYPYLVVTLEDRMSELPEDIRNAIFYVGEEMQYEADRTWEKADADQSKLNALKNSGFELLPGFRTEDRREIQTAMVREWRNSCRQLRESARSGAERITTALALG